MIMTYGELARELGFGNDWIGFLTWADLWAATAPRVRQDHEVPEPDVQAYREAMRQHNQVEEAFHTDDDDDCEGHESLSGASMGESAYCNGSCRTV